MFSIRRALVVLFALITFTQAHLFITYPGWRGNNLATNGTTEDSNGLAKATLDNGTIIYPYGMQWLYPCGGLGTTKNRTKWPVHGGAVGFEPGWFTGHLNAQVYINMGLGTSPPNMSLPLLPATGIKGPSNLAYPGKGICFPQLPMPANYTPAVGDHATIQIIMLAQHGAPLYSCVDIELAEPADVPKVTKENCFNSSEVEFTQIFASTSLTAGAPALRTAATMAWIPLTIAVATALL